MMPYIYNAHSPKNDRSSINYLHCLDLCEITFFFLRQKGKLLTTFQSYGARQLFLQRKRPNVT